jgi:hypothetical protein
VPHQVGARDVTPHAAGRAHADTLRPEAHRRLHDLGGDDAVLEDLLIVVDVVDEFVQRMDALPESPFEPVPFLGANDARHEIERKRALGPGSVAVHVEGDPELHQDPLGRLLTPLELTVAQRADRFEEKLRFGPRPARVVEHLVVEPAGVVALDLHLWSRPRGRRSAVWLASGAVRISKPQATADPARRRRDGADYFGIRDRLGGIAAGWANAARNNPVG